ncbi:MAG TPA: MMPL family transporter [Steroidobacteraceae bacterium]|nr:MMPL family transporter [Steroidobacteraceae bacterium]
MDLQTPPKPLARALAALERFVFGRRLLVLTVLAAFTLLMGFFALQLRMTAGFEKQMPVGHEYVKTFEQYRSQLFGANRLTIAVRSIDGTIWTKQGLTRLYDVTQAIMSMPNVDRVGVQSLWTSNTWINDITPEGFKIERLIPDTVEPASLTPEVIETIRRTTTRGDFDGTLVARDQSSALVTAELNEYDKNDVRLDYIAYNRMLNERIRGKYEDAHYRIEIIGFAKQVGEIADGAQAVLTFCGIALLLVAAAVYWYCRSIRFTVLPIVCSLASLVWQFGTLHLLGFGLDPLAILVPFLVFSIGVSHGVQQINYIVREIAHGKSTFDAARASFSGLLVPGTLALVTAFVSFITLILIPIPMVRELAVTAAIGVGYKIVTNLVMLPVAASYCHFDRAFAERAMLERERRARWLRQLARVSEPRNAVIVVFVTAAVLALAAWQSRDRVVGTLQAGSPELRADSRYNRDAVDIANNYDVGLDWLSVVLEALPSPENCARVALGPFEQDLVWTLQNVPGVTGVTSFTSMMRTYSEGYNENNPKMSVVPIDPNYYAALAIEINRVRGFVNVDCSMTAVHAYLADHKAATITRVIDAVKDFRATNHLDRVKVRLASGNAGVLAAINEEVSRSELPMMLYVYAAIALLVLIAYRDLRAVVACCLPLTVATFVGYWFMKELQIGLTVATLPVMVLAVGIGVDYAFYIYNRLQAHLAQGEPIVGALEHSILEVGMATIFTAITLAIGVVTWSFSALKFQADMGKLLAFMFIINLVMAMTALPALAVVLERIFPRRKPVHIPGVLQH